MSTGRPRPGAVTSLIYLLWFHVLYGVLGLGAMVLSPMSDTPQRYSTAQAVLGAMWLVLLVVAAVYLMSGIAKGDNKTRLAAYGYPVCVGVIPVLVDPGAGATVVIPALLQLYLLRHPTVREWCQAPGHAVEQRS